MEQVSEIDECDEANRPESPLIDYMSSDVETQLPPVSAGLSEGPQSQGSSLERDRRGHLGRFGVQRCSQPVKVTTRGRSTEPQLGYRRDLNMERQQQIVAEELRESSRQRKELGAALSVGVDPSFRRHACRQLLFEAARYHHQQGVASSAKVAASYDRIGEMSLRRLLDDVDFLLAEFGPLHGAAAMQRLPLWR